MKPKHLFWITCVAFAALALKLALDGERYVTLLVVACAVASAANALRPDANRRPSWADIKMLFGIY